MEGAFRRDDVLMNLKNVWEVCEFRDEIRFGKLDRKKFAVELYEVLSGDADEIYLDPEKFLSNTYLTSDMRFLLASALRRLAKNEGNAVYVLDTEFGGGKTHSLILLYHIFTRRDLGTEYIRKYGLDKEYGVLEVPEAKVVAIDCRRMEKKTLWGEIASSLGKYESMKEYDLKEIPPRNIDEIRSLLKSPTLILIDELPVYLFGAASREIGDTNLMELTLNFLTMLVSAVSTSRRVMLVITLTGKQSLYDKVVSKVKERIKESEVGERIETIRDYFTSSVSRQAQFLVPVRDIEVYMVLRKRLIKSLDEAEFKKVVKSYYEYYLDKGLITEPDYKRKMELAYPFHPFLIDVLHERVSTIEKFNRTRGVLWLLSMILHRIYMERRDCKLVTTGDIPLEDAVIRDALTSQLDKDVYINAVKTDVIDKARKIDKGRRVKIAERVARTIYLYSLIAAAKISGIKPSQIKLAICRRGEDPDVVDEILKEMEREFWYLRKEGSEYYFWIEPGINKVIYDYMKEVRDEEVMEEVQKTLRGLFKEVPHVKMVWRWDELSDSQDLRIYVSLKPLSKEDVERMLETTPTGRPREYKNTLIFVFPDKYLLEEVKKDAKTVCAINNAKKDVRIKPDRARIKELKNRLNEAEGDLKASCESAFIKIAYPKVGSGDMEPEEIILTDYRVSKAKNLTERVINFLKSKGKLMEKLNPGSILDVNPIKRDLEEKGYAVVEDVYDAFRRDKRLPFVMSGEVILDAIRGGVKESLFGYAERLQVVDGKYEARIGESVAVSWHGYIIRKDLIAERRPEKPTKVVSGEMPITKPPLVTPRLFKYSVSIEDIDDLGSLLSKALIIKTHGGINFNFSVEIDAEGDRISIKSNLSDINRLKQLVEQIKSIYHKPRIKGSLHIESEKDISDKLKMYEVKFDDVRW